MPEKALRGRRRKTAFERRQERKSKEKGIDTPRIFGKGGEKGGKITLSKSVSLKPSGKTKKVGERVTTGSDDFSPAKRAAERSEDKGPQLGKRLAAIASSVGPGKGKVGSAVSGALSGAAVGATIGEEIDRGRKKKKKAKRE
jgi:hypothetical protein